MSSTQVRRIAFSGKICSGKSTTAAFLQNDLITARDNVVVLSFARRLKDLAAELFNHDEAKKDRVLLQKFGIAIREIDENAWLNALKKQIDALEPDTWIIIDDLRFPNEHAFLRSEGFTIVRLNISRELQEKRIRNLYTDNAGAHLARLDNITETSLDDCEDFDNITLDTCPIEFLTEWANNN